LRCESQTIIADVHLRKSESYAEVEILSSHPEFQMGFLLPLKRLMKVTARSYSGVAWL